MINKIESPKPTLDQLVDEISETLFGLSLTTALSQSICLECQNPVNKDDFSASEASFYKMSGLCPTCLMKIEKEDSQCS